MNALTCDCGTCCNACGHADDCIRNDLDRDNSRYDRDAYTLG